MNKWQIFPAEAIQLMDGDGGFPHPFESFAPGNDRRRVVLRRDKVGCWHVFAEKADKTLLWLPLPAIE